jgi:hypothetical protein
MPIFRSRLDAELTKSIYRRMPILWREPSRGNPENNPWNMKFVQGLFNLSSDSEYFCTSEELEGRNYRRNSNVFVGSHDRYLPLYEAKMLHQFDHRWCTYDDGAEARDVTVQEKVETTFLVQPRYWVQEGRVDSAVPGVVAPQDATWFLGWRDICRSTDERTLIASAAPKVAIGNSFPLIFMRGFSGSHRVAFQAVLDSFVVDYIVRQKVGGAHINFFYLKQIPAPSPDSFDAPLPSSLGVPLVEWLLPRVIELVYTACDLAPLAKDCNYLGPPFAWDEARRFEIRSELDAALFHLYLPCTEDRQWKLAERETPEQLAELKRHFHAPRNAVDYILDQFPLVRQKDEKTHGRYRTKDRILEIYDAMLDAQRTGRPYQTTLNPPPGER